MAKLAVFGLPGIPLVMTEAQSLAFGRVLPEQSTGIHSVVSVQSKT